MSIGRGKQSVDRGLGEGGEFEWTTFPGDWQTDGRTRTVLIPFLVLALSEITVHGTGTPSLLHNRHCNLLQLVRGIVTLDIVAIRFRRQVHSARFELKGQFNTLKSSVVQLWRRFSLAPTVSKSPLLFKSNPASSSFSSMMPALCAHSALSAAAALHEHRASLFVQWVGVRRANEEEEEESGRPTFESSRSPT